MWFGTSSWLINKRNTKNKSLNNIHASPLLITFNSGIVPDMNNNYNDGGFKKRGKSKYGGNSGGYEKRSGGRDRGGERRSGGGKFGSRNSGGRSNETFDAVCSKCNKNCTLPFRPSNDKPVFCSDCFAQKNGESDRNDGRRDTNKNKQSTYPNPTRDERAQVQSNYDLSEMKKQLASIQEQMNKILDIIQSPASETKESATAKKTAAKTTKKAAKKVEKKAVKKVLKKATPTKKAAVKKTPVKKVVKKPATKKVTKKAVAKKASTKKAKK